jgi:stress response protein YsnF
MKTVFGIFDTKKDAQEARDELVAMGIDADKIDLFGGERDVMPVEEVEQKLEAAGVPARRIHDYAESVCAGHVLEKLVVPDEKVDGAIAIMKRHAPPSEAERGAAAEREEAVPSKAAAAEETVATGAPTTAPEGERKLDVIEEELLAGKREVVQGGVRVQTHVREEPVEKELDLATEHVSVERRPVDRPLSEMRAELRDTTLEVVEHAEEPVVQKRARVIEEVVIHTGVEHHAETVRDTVRKTDVNVEPVDPATYREHYEKEVAGSGQSFEESMPAYQFGHGMRHDERFRGEQWEEVEPSARTAWEERNPSTWDRFRAAVRHAWERAKR